MKVTYNWLKDFLEIRIPARALADKLTMAGLEVTSIDAREGDFVFEIEVTSNRPDCLSVIGIAREVAAITGKKLQFGSRFSVLGSRLTTEHRTPNTKHRKLEIQIEDKKDCPLYTAKIIKGVKVGPSPDWLKERLELIGCRSVNNIVDITNYVLFEWGEPLHAFDLDKLGGNSIIVRRAREGETITTIDGLKRQLSPEVLLIADQEKPVAIAGIMGGLDTEVTLNTKNILLEAAIFNPIVVRRARQKLGLMSESSFRFERGVDLGTVQNASSLAVKLIQELCGGECVLAKGAGLTGLKQKTLNLNLPNTNKILGINIASSKIKSILSGLEFKVRPQGKNNLAVSVPPYRQDVNLEIDLIEEIARVYGYERIPTSLPKVRPSITISGTRSLSRPSLKYNLTMQEERDLVSLIKNILVGLGLNEVITYSLMERGKAKVCSPDYQPIGILNPVSREHEVLRPTLIPGLLTSVALNLNQKQTYINIFEIAKVFSGAVDKPREELVLGIALCGTKLSFIGEQGVVKEEAGLLHLKGILEVLLPRLGIVNYSFNHTQSPWEFAIYIGKEEVGKIARIEKIVLEEFEIKNKEVVVLEIALEKILPFLNLEKKFVSLPVYPGISRDISFILKENIKVDDILKAVKERGGSLLEEARIIDYYKGKQIPPGFRGLTISCFYRCPERTLTEAEINPTHSLVCAVLKDRFGAQVR